MPPVHLRHWLFVMAILALYGLFIVPMINRYGIGWDEEIDLRIARGYLSIKEMFFGVLLDLSQTRLPMFSVAVVYRA